MATINWGDYEQMTTQQFIRADVAAKALKDPGILAIFETSDESQYIEQLMLLAMSRRTEYEALSIRYKNDMRLLQVEVHEIDLELDGFLMDSEDD